MSRITITAGDAGFFNLSPLGLPLAPNIFLKIPVNIVGLITSNGVQLESAESEMHSDFEIDFLQGISLSLLPKIEEFGVIPQGVEGRGLTETQVLSTVGSSYVSVKPNSTSSADRFDEVLSSLNLKPIRKESM